MRTKADVRAIYERIADSFAPTRVDAWAEVLEFIDGLPRASRVLDIGCGNGRHVKALIVRGHRAVGLDFCRRLLAIGRAEIASADASWIEAEAGRLPFRDETLDAATCIAVLHHLPTQADRIAALREIGRVLRRDGRVIVSVWDRGQSRFLGLVLDDHGDAEIPWTLPDGSTIGRYYHLFRSGELERTIIESGLHGERFFHSSGNWFALATKHG